MYSSYISSKSFDDTGLLDDKKLTQETKRKRVDVFLPSVCILLINSFSSSTSKTSPEHFYDEFISLIDNLV